VPPHNSWHQTGNMKKVPYWRPTHTFLQKNKTITHAGRPGARDVCTPVINHCLRLKVIDFNCTSISTCHLSVIHEVLQHVSSQHQRARKSRLRKESHYRPGQALRVPGGWGPEISRQSAYEGGKVVSPTHRPPLPPKEMIKYITTFNIRDSFQSMPWTENRILRRHYKMTPHSCQYLGR